MKKYLLALSMFLLLLVLSACDEEEATLFVDKLQIGKEVYLGAHLLLDGDSTRFKMDYAASSIVLWTRVETQYDQNESNIELHLKRIDKSGAAAIDTIIALPYEPLYSTSNIRMNHITLSDTGRYECRTLIFLNGIEGEPREIATKNFTIYR